MAEVYRSGSATLTVEQGAVLAAIDRVSAGAGTSFLAAAEGRLRPLMEGARARWPVRTGRSKAGFQLMWEVGADRLAVSIVNAARSRAWGAYAYKIRWSVRTKASLDAEVEAAAARGTTPETRARIERVFGGRLRARHGQGAPDAAVAGKRPWSELIQRPGKLEAKALVAELQAALARLARGA